MGLDDKKMATVSEPGSTVAKDDANLMSQLKAKNVKITGLKTTLDDFTAVAVPEHLGFKIPRRPSLAGTSNTKRHYTHRERPITSSRRPRT